MYNSRKYTKLRKELRNQATPAERLLWQYLKHSKLSGYTFRRQQGIGRYVVDFYCSRIRLAVEIDGSTHAGTNAEAYDHERTRWLRSCFIEVARFTNAEVLKNVEYVLEELRWIIFFLRYTTPTRLNFYHPQPLLN